MSLLIAAGVVEEGVITVVEVVTQQRVVAVRVFVVLVTAQM